MKIKRSGSGLLLGVVLTLTQGYGYAADQPYSEAEKQMFLANHMKNVPLPAKLHYVFEKKGTLEPGFKDEAVVIVAPGPGGKGNLASVDYLTGEHKLNMSDIGNVEGNPVIMSFLEKEVAEMHRLTKGSANYYRKRIRLALVDDATVKPVTIKYGGKDIKASEIRIAPYLNDPARSRYEKFAGKYYVFTVSEQIPGEVYQMRGVLNDKDAPSDAKAAPLWEETLTFDGVRK